MDQTPNLEFVDLMVARMELLMELRTFQRYGVPQQPGQETDFGQVVEPLRQQMMAVEQRMAHLREQALKKKQALPFDRLCRSFDLDVVEEQILMLALSPMFDASFRKRIARYKDNILLDYVDVDLCLAVLFDTRRERLAAMQWFGEQGRLFQSRILVPSVPKEAGSEHQLAYELLAPGRVVNFVLGRGDIDMAIRSYASLSYPQIPMDHVVLPENTLNEVLNLADQFAGELRDEAARMHSAMGGVEKGGVIAFVGPSGTGKTHTARALASYLEVPALEVDCGRLATDDHRFKQALEAVFWQARLLNAVLILDRPEAIMQENSSKLPTIFAEIERWVGLAVLTVVDQKKIDPTVHGSVIYQFEFEAPELAERERLWAIHLPESPKPLDVSTEELGTQYEITGSQIRNACLVAANMALSEDGDGEKHITMDHLKRAAYTQMRASLTQYARKSKVKLTLADLILPDDEKKEIESIIEAARSRAYVMSKWGFGRKLTTGKGLVTMFCGEPGTGKTLCAEIMANMLELQLYHISIPQVMSKYIGETEKNIAEIFATAKANHAMLLFDEADSLFSSRVKVESSVDKFSNMETNLLLQEIERFEGVIILTTNLDKSIDKAFQRRIQFKVTFPFPKPEDRARIWQLLFPKECPLDEENMDWDLLGKSFEISGGHIKNAVLRAAYRAACTDGIVTMETIRFAAEQECKQAGKLFRSFSLDDDDF